MLFPIGISNFEKLINYTNPNGDRYLYVDKSLFINLKTAIENQIWAPTSKKNLNFRQLHSVLCSAC